ncbi:MAG: PCRF domain-containing protein [Parcubacteria group bacterium]|nr:PCRF domain-containing protein [Parcubacteria group bacterium]
MVNDKKAIEARIQAIEEEMSIADFWNNKEKAHEMVKELNELKAKAVGVNKYDKGHAIITIFSGAGGDDAEDFSRMLYDMYLKYIERQGWGVRLLHKNENNHNGFRNVTVEVEGKNAYGTLKNESGVHRLVRVSPFSAKKLRHTSFSMVEVIPKIEKKEIDISPNDIKIEFARSSGPGGQNVNKRETAVRIVHIPTNISVHVDSERSQESNRQKALEILKGKLFVRAEKERAKEDAGFHVSKTTEAEWGNQMRSYVLHPYKMVKDHRSGVEVRDTDAVLLEGRLDEFIEKERDL